MERAGNPVALGAIVLNSLPATCKIIRFLSEVFSCRIQEKEPLRKFLFSKCNIFEKEPPGLSLASAKFIL